MICPLCGSICLEKDYEYLNKTEFSCPKYCYIAVCYEGYKVFESFYYKNHSVHLDYEDDILHINEQKIGSINKIPFHKLSDYDFIKKILSLL